MKIVKLLICYVSVILITFILFNLKELNKNESLNDDFGNLKDKKEERLELSLIMGGDALIHGSLYRDAQIDGDNYDFTYLFKHIEPYIKNHDLAFYNQETIIGGATLGYSSYPRFNTPYQFAEVMVDLGFNLISLANNHSLDKGVAGVEHSVSYWKGKDVLVAGSYLSWSGRNQIQVKWENGISYSLLSYTTTTNGLKASQGQEYLVNVFDYEQVATDIKRLRPLVDLLIVSMHWGNEYTNIPNHEQKAIAHFLADLGVDLIIGHHSHVIQPISYINGCLVFYSLGNFVSAQKGSDRLTGMLASLKVTKDESKQIAFSNLEVQLIYTYYKDWRDFKIIPYQMLTKEFLVNYEEMFEKYSNIITSLCEDVVILN